jgi:hypothetical protein
VSLIVLPEVAELFVGRSGGLGGRLTLLKLPLGIPGASANLARWGFTLYVTNPRLAPMATRILDFTDGVVSGLDHAWGDMLNLGLPQPLQLHDRIRGSSAWDESLKLGLPKPLHLPANAPLRASHQHGSALDVRIEREGS